MKIVYEYGTIQISNVITDSIDKLIVLGIIDENQTNL